MSLNKLYFNFILISIFFIFLSFHINLSFNLFFWCILAGILIYIINNYYNQLYIDDTNKNIQKFNNIITNPSEHHKYRLIKKYSDINDFVFYLLDIKHYNHIVFDNIIYDLNKFLSLYEECLIDYKLINPNFNKMIDIKNNTSKNLEAIYISNSNSNFIKFNSNSFQIQKILDKYIDNIIDIQNKNIYYNGYNINTKIIDNYPVTEFNRNFNNFIFI